MSAARPKVSVVIASFNGRDLLPMILDSLAGQTMSDFDITVVDDGSTDDTIEYLRREWADVRLIAQDENTGYVRACNRGVGATSGEYVATVDNDIEFEPDWLERLARALDEDSRLGFVTSKILFHSQRDLIYQAGHEYYAYGWCCTRGYRHPDDGSFDEPHPSAGAAGAGSMFRRAAWDAAGGLDPDFVTYCDDVDVALRILLQGYRGLYLPAPAGFHLESATMGQSSDRGKYLYYRNQTTTLLKDVPWPVLWRALPMIALYHYHQYAAERAIGSGRVVLTAYWAAIRQLPKTLSKRRQIQHARRISPEEFRSLVRWEYPFETRFPRLAGQTRR